MSETSTPSRLETIHDPGNGDPVAPASARPLDPPVAVSPRPAGTVSPLADQLARLEDKTARIEEKLSRSEGFTARVIDRFEHASQRMNEVAQQSELAAVRAETKFIARRTRALPGFGALVLTSVITAVLTAVLTVLIIRYMPALIGR